MWTPPPLIGGDYFNRINIKIEWEVHIWRVIKLSQYSENTPNWKNPNPLIMQIEKLRSRNSKLAQGYTESQRQSRDRSLMWLTRVSCFSLGAFPAYSCHSLTGWAVPGWLWSHSERLWLVTDSHSQSGLLEHIIIMNLPNITHRICFLRHKLELMIREKFSSSNLGEKSLRKSLKASMSL